MRRIALFLAAVAIAAAAAAGADAPAQNAAPAGATIASLTFEGQGPFKTEDLLKETSLKVGDGYTEGAEILAARLVRSFYQRNGYLEAEVAGSSTAAPGAVNLHFRIEPGPLYRFADTQVE